MDKELYQHYFEHEETHWWFVARRQIIKKVLDTYAPNQDSASNTILEIGTGTGGNLKMLSKFISNGNSLGSFPCLISHISLDLAISQAF
ncbi:hypothetical protein DID74_01590 [Candidatus Marinamargulisbacteria bacterium SCGC AG-333-B06]|nr:hypothetical protein DID74_01590 [Candidatus Marinamargulisbacteria bacterium SCGC AG-333-B06]